MFAIYCVYNYYFGSNTAQFRLFHRQVILHAEYIMDYRPLHVLCYKRTYLIAKLDRNNSRAVYINQVGNVYILRVLLCTRLIKRSAAGQSTDMSENARRSSVVRWRTLINENNLSLQCAVSIDAGTSAQLLRVTARAVCIVNAREVMYQYMDMY